MGRHSLLLSDLYDLIVALGPDSSFETDDKTVVDGYFTLSAALRQKLKSIKRAATDEKLAKLYHKLMNVSTVEEKKGVLYEIYYLDREELMEKA